MEGAHPKWDVLKNEMATLVSSGFFKMPPKRVGGTNTLVTRTLKIPSRSLVTTLITRLPNILSMCWFTLPHVLLFGLAYNQTSSCFMEIYHSGQGFKTQEVHGDKPNWDS